MSLTNVIDLTEEDNVNIPTENKVVVHPQSAATDKCIQDTKKIKTTKLSEIPPVDSGFLLDSVKLIQKQYHEGTLPPEQVIRLKKEGFDFGTAPPTVVASRADIDKVDEHGRTPLFNAALNNNKDIIQFLIAKKADVNKANDIGWTPLYIAAFYGHKDIVQLLIQKKADFDKPDSDGCTPLFNAACNNDKDILQLLIAKKADINKTDFLGRTPTYIAAKNGHKDVVQILIEKRDKDIVQLLIASDSEESSTNEKKSSQQDTPSHTQKLINDQQEQINNLQQQVKNLESSVELLKMIVCGNCQMQERLQEKKKMQENKQRECENQKQKRKLDRSVVVVDFTNPTKRQDTRTIEQAQPQEVDSVATIKKKIEDSLHEIHTLREGVLSLKPKTQVNNLWSPSAKHKMQEVLVLIRKLDTLSKDGDAIRFIIELAIRKNYNLVNQYILAAGGKFRSNNIYETVNAGGIPFFNGYSDVKKSNGEKTLNVVVVDCIKKNSKNAKVKLLHRRGPLKSSRKHRDGSADYFGTVASNWKKGLSLNASPNLFYSVTYNNKIVTY